MKDMKSEQSGYSPLIYLCVVISLQMWEILCLDGVPSRVEAMRLQLLAIDHEPREVEVRVLFRPSDMDMCRRD